MQIPEPGAIIRTNYKTGPYRVVRVRRFGQTYSFICHDADDPSGRKGERYLNGYKIIDGRLLGSKCIPGSAGYQSHGGGLNGDGYNEIIVESPALQPMLFVL